jgi:TetR/AcrR family transcriptional regulator, regulator of cefoperazone and chloramphenicol sensitivity
MQREMRMTKTSPAPRRGRTRRAVPQAAAADTRARLLEAAGEVFAESGYQAATVRRISARAGVNVALVNYHFRDKLGLYNEVLRDSIRAAHLEPIRHALDQAAPPEEILRRVVQARLESIRSAELPDRHVRIFIHELAQPTPALSRVVQESARPIYDRMRNLIGSITGLPPDHEKTRLCSNSIMGQILLYALAGPVLTRLWPELKMTPAQIHRIADHIADFSLAYLRESRTAPEKRK